MLSAVVNTSGKIRELHKQYGPIVRISPMEVHISDPDFYGRDL